MKRRRRGFLTLYKNNQINSHESIELDQIWNKKNCRELPFKYQNKNLNVEKKETDKMIITKRQEMKE